MLDITSLFTAEVTLSAVKIALLIGEGLYAVFAYIVVRQVSLMNETFRTEFGPIFKLLAFIHFYAVLGIMVLTLLLL